MILQYSVNKKCPKCEASNMDKIREEDTNKIYYECVSCWSTFYENELKGID